ncbi:hypothetical protein [Pseudoalteromonas maricaloris]|uniref:hypothetical protein n=1 Tax=Pseudoalteromonas maricaloris TaxID=184924 RepID=UPI00029A08D3|nr:hypothetical protein [Pseudoalteromonas flavipulchra]
MPALSPNPSFTVTTEHGELIFQLQTAENITGGLHSKYELDLASYFIALKNKDKPAIDYNIAYQVHELLLTTLAYLTLETGWPYR